MRELKPVEPDAVAGGGAPEFRTLIRHEIPRFENPPIGLDHQNHRAEDHCEYRSPMPIPMYWLPPHDDVPRVF